MISNSPCASIEVDNNLLFEQHLQRIAVGNMTAIRVIGPCDSPRSHPGDIMILDECDLADCIDSDYLAIAYNDKVIIRQKTHIDAIIRRCALYAVGGNLNADIIHIMGRVIGWLHAGLIIYAYV